MVLTRVSAIDGKFVGRTVSKQHEQSYDRPGAALVAKFWLIWDKSPMPKKKLVVRAVQCDEF